MTTAVLAQAADECGALDIGCNLGGAVGNWFTEQVNNLAASAVETLAYALTWWTDEDRSSMLQEPAINEIRGLLLYVGLVLLTGGVMWQGVQMMIKRKADPLVTTAMGLLKFLGWSSLGTTIALLLYQCGVVLSTQVLKSSLDGFPEKLAGAMTAYMMANPTSGPWTIFFVAGLLWVLGLIQWVLGYIKMGALVILLSLLPTAAAGQLTESTKPWLPKTISWCLVIVCYQPVGSVIYAVGFKLTSDGQSLGMAFTGVATVGLATVAMPAMYRFFSWGGMSLVSGGGSGSGVGAAMAGGMSQLAQGLGSGGNSMTRYMDQNGPASNTGGNSGAPPSVESAHQGDSSSGPAPNPQGQTGAPSEPGVHSANQGNAGTSAPTGNEVTSAAGTGSTGGTAATGGTSGSATAGTAGAGTAAAGATPAGAAVLAAEATKDTGGAATGAVSNAMTNSSNTSGDAN
jgi:type IV secretion system protein TrbL